MKITLRQIQVFAHVARYESVSKAADALALSQSATSMALSELESNLEKELFHRAGKRLKLNDFGRQLQPQCQQLLDLATLIEHSASNAPIQGHLRIGASSTIGNYVLPELIASFSASYPDIHIDLAVANTEQILHQMLHLQIDIAFIEGSNQHTQLQATDWSTDELVIFTSPKIADHLGPEPTTNTLINLPWVLREPGSGTREVFQQALGTAQNELHVKLELGNSEAIKQAVKAGMGLSCLSRRVVANEFFLSELIEVRTKRLNLTRQFYSVYLRNKKPGVLAQAFLDHSTHFV